MNLDELKKPLSIKDIDFRVQSVNKGGYATILAYKDARVDMDRLDSVCGVLGWKREHVRDNRNCIVSIWDKDNNQWVSKEDTGSESMAEAQKGLASDSFKRACFNWGIGRELYNYPLIQVKLNDKEFDKTTKKATYGFKLKEWSWESSFNNGELLELTAKDNNGNIRFSFVSKIDISKDEENLKSCKTEDELKKVFLNLSREKQLLLTKLKDKLKLEVNK